MQQHRPYWHTKVPQYSFSGSIYTCQIGVKTIRCHKQTVGKIATTVVLDKDENLSWSGLQWHRSCHSNVMTPLSIILAALFLPMKSFSAGAFSSNSRLDVREVKTDSVRALSGYFGIKFLSLENTVKQGKTWCLAVICRKRTRFWHTISPHSSFNLFKMCVNYVKDNSGQLLQRRISLLCIMALLLAVL